jgi:hypothetical protein
VTVTTRSRSEMPEKRKIKLFQFTGFKFKNMSTANEAY